jgi:subtilisin family serine protease
MSVRSRTGRKALAVAVTTSLAVLTCVITGPSATAADPADSPSAVPVPIAPPPDPGTITNTEKFNGALQRAPRGVQRVFVELSGKGALQASTEASSRGLAAADARSSADSEKEAIAATSDSVVTAAKAVDPGAEQLFQVSNAVPGIGLQATTDALAALATRPDVVKISALVPKKFDNAGAAQLTKVLDTWQSLGVTGDGVKVGIIDTGIDYTHADFGGPGTVPAWDQAHADPAGPFTPTAKVVGGFDFVGDGYNADPVAADYQPVAHPDPNPLDCNGHGTHVAGTAAGYGVNDDGSTFTGDYAGLTGDDLFKMRVGPGMAPKASLYALKVFGCTGSTDLVIPALDWALDPDGNGDFSDHLDIVNLSLGSDYVPVDDPENKVIDELAEFGVLPVIAAGNNGDLTDTGGSPGNAVRSLAVASSVDQYQLRDGLKVNSPDDLGIVAGQASVAFPWATEPDVTGDVVAIPDAANLDGCRALSPAAAAAVAGKVAWLEWDDNDATRRCGSAVRSGNVQVAGAIGAIFTSGVEVFGAGISGSALIPVFQLPKSGTDALRPALDAGTLNVTFSGSLLATIKDVTPSIADTVSIFTSRGVHGSNGVVKPDVAAPGDTVASAKMGSGNGVLVESGTSMATPMTAGIAALVKKSHPEWSPVQVKAAIMNTAGHDLYTGADQTGDRYGPARVGAGRIDALAAVKTNLLAYASGTAGAVSASFGVVEAPIGRSTVTRTKSVRIQNTGDTAAELSASYDGVVSQPGVSYEVRPSSVRVRAHGSATVRVVMTVHPSELRKTIDPTMDALQTDPFAGVDRARQFVSDASGRLLISQTGQPDLRVPVYGAAKPVSTTNARDAGSRTGAATIQLRGNGFQQGDGSNSFASMVSVLDLGFTSRRLPICTTAPAPTGCTSGPTTVAGDIQYVGAGATRDIDGSKANGRLWFGMSTYGNWATIGNVTVPYVDIDTTGDGEADFEVFVQNEPSTDLLTAFLVDLPSHQLIGLAPVNFADGNVDTNPFDTNTLLIPVDPAAIGLTDADTTFPISYTTGTSSIYGSTALDGDIDRTPPVSFDVANPRIQVSSPLFYDGGGVGIPYRLGTQPAASGIPSPAGDSIGVPTPSVAAQVPAVAADSAAATDPSVVVAGQIQLASRGGTAARPTPATALLLHLHGKSGARAEVLTLHG